MDRKLAVVSLAGVLGLSGCAAATHFNKEVGLNATGSDNATYSDAKQRVVVSKQMKVRGVDPNGKLFEDQMRVFCAEPSPDALSAIAATLGLDVALSKGDKAALTSSLSEGAANIGVRTAALQVLRDITYRDCEAYANGGVTPFGLETLQRRFQSSMVSILAVEQLTGAVRAPNLVLLGNTTPADGAAIVKLAENVTATRDKLDKAKKDESDALADQKTKADDLTELESKSVAAKAIADDPKALTADRAAKQKEHDGLVATDIPQANAKKSDADKKVEAAQSTRKDMETALAALERTQSQLQLAGGGTGVTGASQAAPTQALDAASVASIGKSIENIVSSTLQLGFGREICTTVIGAQLYVGSRDGTGLQSPERIGPLSLDEPTPLASCLKLLDEQRLQYATERTLALAAMQSRQTEASARADVLSTISKLAQQQLSKTSLKPAEAVSVITALGSALNVSKVVSVSATAGEAQPETAENAPSMFKPSVPFSAFSKRPAPTATLQIFTEAEPPELSLTK